jgi:hypothetical protein
MPLTLTKNSSEGQLEQMKCAFETIRQKAEDYEQHEKGTIAKLYATLADLYSFGETIRAAMGENGQPLTQQFITHRGGKWSKPAQGNPYIALLGLTFSGLSAPLKSQYAQVLHHAHRTHVSTKLFGQWLATGNGIKGRLEEATELNNSTARQINSQAKRSRLENAKSVLRDGPRSAFVALPTTTQHKGFATVLVEIDDNNNASILRVLDTEDSKIDPLLLKLEPGGATTLLLSAQRPLGRLHRAIDLILNLIDVQDLKDGHIQIVNRLEGGRAIACVHAIATNYSYMWAGVVLEGHLPTLPVDHALSFDIARAQEFQSDFVKFDDWGIMAGAQGYELFASSPMPKTMMLSPLPSDKTFRIGAPVVMAMDAIVMDQGQTGDVLCFIEQWRADAKRQNARRKVLRQSPRRLAMAVNNDVLQLLRDDAPHAVTDFLTTKRKSRLTESRWLAIPDVERICRTLSKYECDATGWFVDGDVADAALQFDTIFANSGGTQDSLTILLPTVISNGMHYAQCCRDIIETECEAA